MTGLLNPKSSECQSCFENYVFVYLGHTGQFMGCNLIFAEVSFRVRHGGPQVRSLGKNRVSLYRRTPRLCSPQQAHPISARVILRHFCCTRDFNGALFRLLFVVVGTLSMCTSARISRASASRAVITRRERAPIIV